MMPTILSKKASNLWTALAVSPSSHGDKNSKPLSPILVPLPHLPASVPLDLSSSSASLQSTKAIPTSPKTDKSSSSHHHRIASSSPYTSALATPPPSPGPRASSKLSPLVDHYSPSPLPPHYSSFSPMSPPKTPTYAQQHWYSERKLHGKADLELYSPTRSPYWLSYSGPSLNWDALLQQVQNALTLRDPVTDPIPDRVLDIGSGVSAPWCLATASDPAWSNSHFVALDVAPPRIPFDLLPPNVAARVQYVCADFLETLPFEEEDFDLVRIAFVGVGVPQHLWEGLIDEALRVLKPGGMLEIVETNIVVLRERKSSKPTEPLATNGRKKQPESYPYPDVQHDPFVVVDECLDAVLSERSIHPDPLALLTQAFSATELDLDFSASITVDVPSEPRHTTPPTVKRCTPANKQEAVQDELARSDVDLGRIFLHAYAEKMHSSLYGLTYDAAERRLANVAHDQHHHPHHHSQIPPLEKVQRELGHSLASWCDDLKDRAALSELLETKWNWSCKFDVQLEQALHESIPLCRAKIEEYDRGWAATSSELNDDSEFDLEFRKLQLLYFRSEAESELRDVTARLKRSKRRSSPPTTSSSLVPPSVDHDNEKESNGNLVDGDGDDNDYENPAPVTLGQIEFGSFRFRVDVPT